MAEMTFSAAFQRQLREEARIHLEEAEKFWTDYNGVQTLSFCELAMSKLKQLLNSFSLDVTEMLDDTLRLKFNALSYMGQHTEALECARERYSLWNKTNIRNPDTSDEDDALTALHGILGAAFPLIESLIHNNEYIEAEPIARITYETIIINSGIIIPENQRHEFLAQGSKLLAIAIYWLAYSNGIPAEEKVQAGVEAIALARNALEIDTQLHGDESDEIAFDLLSLADLLKYFNGDDDDEVLRLYERAIAIYRRVQGHLSPNVAVGENNLGNAYQKRADAALYANDLSRCMTNLDLAMSHFFSAERIFRTINHIDAADRSAQRAINIETKSKSIQNQLATSVGHQ